MSTSDFLIAGLRYRLADACAITRSDLESRLPEFRVEPDGEPDVLLSAERTPEAPNPDLFGQEAKITREPGGRIAAHRCDFEGFWDAARREARCQYTDSIASLSSFLRVVSSFALLERGGVLLHASSVASNGRGFVFAGPSGAGKTTLARLGAPRPVLSDEVAALRPGRPGVGFTSYPTPFWGDMVRVQAGPSAPLAAIGFPLHAGGAFLRPATSSEALSRLLECVIAFDLRPEEKAGLVDVAAAILRSVPCLHVEYGLEHPPWDLLDALPSAS